MSSYIQNGFRFWNVPTDGELHPQFWGWGTTSGSLLCSKEQVPVGGGGPIPGP